MQKRTWTDADLTFLRSNFESMTRAKLAEHLRCPASVLSRKIKELGLRKRHAEPNIGEKFGRLTIEEKFNRPHHNQQKTFARVRCDCGVVKEYLLTCVVNGVFVSCGCWKAEKAAERTRLRNYKHGKGDLKTRLYRIWCAMKSRCYNKNTEHYEDYGGRGIVVCDEWRSNFLAFEQWSLANGYADNLTIDRQLVNGNYEPSNCRWVTTKVQNGNRRNNRRDTVTVQAFGESKTLAQWVQDSRCQVSSSMTLCYRLGAGWSPEDAISKPSQRTYASVA